MDSVLSKSGLTVERLKSFCEIVAAGSMVAAATGDPAKQSHYSRQIKDLEKVLGFKLFIKEGKYLRPNDQGKRLAALTNMYFHGLEDLGATADAEQPRLRIGAIESALRWILMPHLQEILAAAGQHLPDFLSARTAEVIEGVRTGRFDLGVVREDAVDESLAAVACGALEYALVVPRRLLLGKSAAGLDPQKKLPIAALAGEGQFAHSSIELLKRNGIMPLVRLRTQSFSMIIEAMRAAEIAAFVPAPAVQEFPKDQFAVVDLDGISRLGRKLYLVYEPTASSLRPVARALGGKIAQICRQTQRRDD
ncbi:MAG: LysR family transcriptional regulator [Opitutaceae bacterium]